jgi:mannose-6-phosphate isomerase
MYPLKFTPVYQERVWGGTNFREKYGRVLPPGLIGESWELSAHPNGLSLVENGPLAGNSIPGISEKYGTVFLGNRAPASAYAKFPLLVKLLDAQDKLSVQVHPGNDYALKNEGELGKFEIWYILSAKPGSKIVYGLKPGTTKENFKEAIEAGNVEKYLNDIEVKPGDVYIIPPGLVHALGAGIMVAEIQQNSDTVYRVYDYNRLDNGKPRQLHISKALDVIRFDGFLPEHPIQPQPNIRLVDSDFFKVDFYHETSKEFYNDGNRFYILTNLKGEALLKSQDGELKWCAGESILIPADQKHFHVEGDVEFLVTYLP